MEKHVVLVAKYPRPGRSKTRLMPAFSAEFCALFAEVCLKDLINKLLSLDSSVGLHLLFTPEADKEDYQKWMVANFRGDGAQRIRLMPFTRTGQVTLTDILQFGVDRVIEINPFGTSKKSICFIGMDSPQLPTEELTACFDDIEAESKRLAKILPAEDGGYALLCFNVFDSLRCGFFDEIRWSCENTGQDQINILISLGFDVIKGDTYLDVDEEKDLKKLIELIKMDPEICPLVKRFLAQQNLL